MHKESTRFVNRNDIFILIQDFKIHKMTFAVLTCPLTERDRRPRLIVNETDKGNDETP